MLGRDIFEQFLVEEAKDLPALEQFEKTFLVLRVARAPLEDKTNDEFQLVLEVANVQALHVLHDVVHDVEVDELALLLLYSPNTQKTRTKNS